MIGLNKDNLALNIMEAIYVEMMKEKPDFKDMDDILLLQIIFPPYWHSSSNEELKIKLLKDALKYKKNLKEFPEIVQFEEGIR